MKEEGRRLRDEGSEMGDEGRYAPNSSYRLNFLNLLNLLNLLNPLNFFRHFNEVTVNSPWGFGKKSIGFRQEVHRVLARNPCGFAINHWRVKEKCILSYRNVLEEQVTVFAANNCCTFAAQKQNNYDASEHAILRNPVQYRFEPQILVINRLSTEFHLAFFGIFSNFAPYF